MNYTDIYNQINSQLPNLAEELNRAEDLLDEAKDTWRAEGRHRGSESDKAVDTAWENYKVANRRCRAVESILNTITKRMEMEPRRPSQNALCDGSMQWPREWMREAGELDQQISKYLDQQ